MDGLKYFNVDLMDAEGPDMVLDIPEGKVIQKNYVGKDMVKYDGMIVLSHFKGHPMGGYGGALKQTFNWLCIILWKSVYPWSRGT